jgi:hypothetical protein
MRTDTVTFCGEWNILAHFDERSNSEYKNLTTDEQRRGTLQTSGFQPYLTLSVFKELNFPAAWAALSPIQSHQRESVLAYRGSGG